jgi:XisI protein
MDRVEHYRLNLQSIITRHAQFQPANGNIQTHAVADPEKGDFMVIDSGWNEKGRRIYDVVIHFRIRDGVVNVERDNTDAEIVRELLESGIRKTNIILAYNVPNYRQINDLMAA